MDESVKELLALKGEDESIADFLDRLEDAMSTLYDIQDERDEIAEEVAEHCDAIAEILDATAILIKHNPDDNEVFIHALLSDPDETEVSFRG